MAIDIYKVVTDGPLAPPFPILCRFQPVARRLSGTHGVACLKSSELKHGVLGNHQWKAETPHLVLLIKIIIVWLKYIHNIPG